MYSKGIYMYIITGFFFKRKIKENFEKYYKIRHGL